MNILDDIVRHKRDQVLTQKRTFPVSAFREDQRYLRTTVSLSSALQQAQPMGFIAEIKRASPSAGVMNNDVNPSLLAREYERNGASAVSVLTDRDYFRGSSDDLIAVRSATSLPILRKDFIIDEYQIHEARAIGADAILLIASILERNALQDLFSCAASLGLDSLVEVYDFDDLDKIDFESMRLLGINNRNLRTFSVNIYNTIRIAELVPKGVLIVSESGLQSPNDLKLLRGTGIRGVLIGEYLMRSPDPGRTLHFLRESLEHDTH